jgi:hypothetical protein
MPNVQSFPFAFHQGWDDIIGTDKSYEDWLKYKLPTVHLPTPPGAAYSTSAAPIGRNGPLDDICHHPHITQDNVRPTSLGPSPHRLVTDRPIH